MNKQRKPIERYSDGQLKGCPKRLADTIPDSIAVNLMFKRAVFMELAAGPGYCAHHRRNFDVPMEVGHACEVLEGYRIGARVLQLCLQDKSELYFDPRDGFMLYRYHQPRVIEMEKPAPVVPVLQGYDALSIHEFNDYKQWEEELHVAIQAFKNRCGIYPNQAIAAEETWGNVDAVVSRDPKYPDGICSTSCRFPEIFVQFMDFLDYCSPDVFVLAYESGGGDGEQKAA